MMNESNADFINDDTNADDYYENNANDPDYSPGTSSPQPQPPIDLTLDDNDGEQQNVIPTTNEKLLSDINLLVPLLLSQKKELDRLYSENEDISSFKNNSNTRSTRSEFTTDTNKCMNELFGDKWFSTTGYTMKDMEKNGPRKRNPNSRYDSFYMNNQIIHTSAFIRKLERSLDVLTRCERTNDAENLNAVVDNYLVGNKFIPSNISTSAALFTSFDTFNSFRRVSPTEGKAIFLYEKLLKEQIFNHLKESHKNAVLLRQLLSVVNKGGESILAPSTLEDFEKLHFLYSNKQHVDIPATSEFTECIVCKETNCKSYVFIKRRCQNTCQSFECCCKSKMCYSCAVKAYWSSSNEDQKSSGKCPSCNSEYCLQDLEVLNFTEDTTVVEELEGWKKKHENQEKEIKELKTQIQNLRSGHKKSRSKTKERRNQSAKPYG